MDASAPAKHSSPEEWADVVIFLCKLKDRPDKDRLHRMITQGIQQFEAPFDLAREQVKSVPREAASIALQFLGRSSSRKEAQNKAEIEIWKTALDIRISLYEAFAVEGKPGIALANKVWGSLIQNAVASYSERYGKYYQPMVAKPEAAAYDHLFIDQENRLQEMERQTEKNLQGEEKARAYCISDGKSEGRLQREAELSR